MPFSGDAPHFTYRSNGSLIRAFDDIINGGNTNQCAVDEYCTVSAARICTSWHPTTTAVSTSP